MKCTHNFKLKGIITKNAWDRSYSPSELTNYGHEESATIYCSKCLYHTNIDWSAFSDYVDEKDTCKHDFNLICSLEKYEYTHYHRNDRIGYCSATSISVFVDVYCCNQCGKVIRRK